MLVVFPRVSSILTQNAAFPGEGHCTAEFLNHLSAPLSLSSLGVSLISWVLTFLLVLSLSLETFLFPQKFSLVHPFWISCDFIFSSVSLFCWLGIHPRLPSHVLLDPSMFFLVSLFLNCLVLSGFPQVIFSFELSSFPRLSVFSTLCLVPSLFPKFFAFYAVVQKTLLNFYLDSSHSFRLLASYLSM